ncbi:MAG TPA: NAD(P)H-dependent glycerol-3-phosphate dehydrogenase [Methylomirabilota bacterium]|nr:NAD(P)H-dependent glycerol-3-phosphate dehydrogenase [Methylomirabilota bacterium]
MTRIAILGGGSWGTALAILLGQSPKNHAVSLWVHDPEIAAAIRRDASNSVYLPGFRIPSQVRATSDEREVLAGAEIVLGVVPSAYARTVYCRALPHLGPQMALVSATKGLEPGSHARMSEVISQVVSPRFPPRIAVLSGPSFAIEAARGDPTAVVLASPDPALAAFVQAELSGPTFRLYTNEDVVGVESASAMKNVIAIAAGACQGLGLGSNSLAALITRGLAEMTRLAVAQGGSAATLSGLAGLGDLVLTCTGALSRNRHVGVELAKGRALAEILSGMRMVAEGVHTAAAVLASAATRGVEMPITEQVSEILAGKRAPADAIRAIMDRPLKAE